MPRSRRPSKSEDKRAVTPSSGNVFADLGFTDAGERQTRVRLALAINQIIERRRLTQTKAARLLGINQPKISALSKYRLDGFSVERLLEFVTALNCNVEIIIRNGGRVRKVGRITVNAA